MKNLLILLMTIFSFTVLGNSDPKKAYADAEAGNAVLIDVREASELKSGMVKKAKWFPLSRMKESQSWNKDFLKLTQGKTIYLYCRTGNRSGQALEILKNLDIPSQNIGGFESLKEILPTQESNTK